MVNPWMLLYSSDLGGLIMMWDGHLKQFWILAMEFHSKFEDTNISQLVAKSLSSKLIRMFEVCSSSILRTNSGWFGTTSLG